MKRRSAGALCSCSCVTLAQCGTVSRAPASHRASPLSPAPRPHAHHQSHPVQPECTRMPGGAQQSESGRRREARKETEGGELDDRDGHGRNVARFSAALQPAPASLAS
eukprot:3611537-Rhodomonas_salina.1